MKRGILIACTFATALGSLVVAAPASANTCPYGTLPKFEGVCIAGQGSAPPPGITVPPQGAEIVTMPGEFARVNGIPCTQEHYATCYAMSQQP